MNGCHTFGNYGAISAVIVEYNSGARYEKIVVSVFLRERVCMSDTVIIPSEKIQLLYSTKGYRARLESRCSVRHEELQQLYPRVEYSYNTCYGEIFIG